MGALAARWRAKWLREAGVDSFQCYLTSDLGLIAYETASREGMVVDESAIVEIVRPGTAGSRPDGEVGELVVTSLNPSRNWTGRCANSRGRSSCGIAAARSADGDDSRNWPDYRQHAGGQRRRPEQLQERPAIRGVERAGATSELQRR